MELINTSHLIGRKTSALFILLLTAAVAVEISAAPPAFSTLEPGAFRNIEQDLPVNVVFVGYEPGAAAQQINEAAFRAGLPAVYRNLERDTGLDDRYDPQIRSGRTP